MTKQNCKVCGKGFETRPENIKRGWGLTCSKSCAAILRKEASTKKVYNEIKVKFAGQVEIISPPPFTLKNEITIKCSEHGESFTTLANAKNRFHLCAKCSKRHSYLVKSGLDRFISETHKECLDCKQVFERSYYKHDAKGHILARCPECNKSYQTERNRKHSYKNSQKTRERTRQRTAEQRISKGVIPSGKNAISVCTCLQCNKLFTVKGTKAKMFCSKDCRLKGRVLIHTGKQLIRQEKEYQCVKCKSNYIGKHPGKCYECREYDNKLTIKAHKKKRKAALKTVAIHAVKDIKVFERDKWKCRFCGCKVQKVNIYSDNAAELDHIVPVSLGGPHSYSNVQTLCRRCNQQKSNNYNGQLILSV